MQVEYSTIILFSFFTEYFTTIVLLLVLVFKPFEIDFIALQVYVEVQPYIHSFITRINEMR